MKEVKIDHTKIIKQELINNGWKMSNATRDGVFFKEIKGNTICITFDVIHPITQNLCCSISIIKFKQDRIFQSGELMLFVGEINKKIEMMHIMRCLGIN